MFKLILTFSTVVLSIDLLIGVDMKSYLIVLVESSAYMLYFRFSLISPHTRLMHGFIFELDM